jgi:tetratricopeptide (TPR) repeat protein
MLAKRHFSRALAVTFPCGGVRHVSSVAGARSEDYERAHDPAADEETRWWPIDTKLSGRMYRRAFDPTKKPFQAMLVPEVKEVPTQGASQFVAHADDESFFTAPEIFLTGDVFSEEKRFLPPPSFDPAFDDIEEQEFNDGDTMKEVFNAAHEDKKRLEAFGNPLSAEDQIDLLLAPQREGQEIRAQREDFNGFVHWGLLKAADISMEQEKDYKRSHTFVSRYLRDVDLFQQWLKHPKVVKHIKRKFNIDISNKFDKLMAITMALFVRSKIQSYEGDFSAALKSLVGAAGMINEGGNLSIERHRRALGAILAARGMVYLQLKSWERAEDDLTRCLPFLPSERFATIYQLRAEAREQQGKILEAREDELKAADIWEEGETIHPGLDHPPVKFVQ